MASTSTRTPSAPQLALTSVLVLGAVSTLFTALGLSWAQVYLQFFGEQADRSDYGAAAGVLGAGAVLLLLAIPVSSLFGLPWTPAVLAGAGAVILAVAAVSTAGQMGAAEPGVSDAHLWREGAMTLMSAPWCWILPALLVAGLVTACCTPSSSR
ncbi:MAG TPA: hypothetical protein VFJ89_15005 [Nocardioides sp.]|jgi:hypothetical protein|nr:hypothetical protein [Nocardioides sp.]